MAFLLCGLFFVHMGRFEWRVTSGITLSCVLLFIIMTSEFHLRKVAFRKVIRIITLCLTLSITILTATYTLQKKAFQFPSAEITDTKKAELLDYMNSNSNIVYFAENDFYSAYNIWASRPVNYLQNQFTIFSIFNRGRSSDFARYGIGGVSNFIMYMITRPNVYTIYDDTWRAYLCDYYSPYISAGIVDTFKSTGTEFIRYVAPITPVGTTQTQQLSNIHLSIDQSAAQKNYQILTFSGTINGSASSEYYLNISDSKTGAIYSYPLVINGNQLSGRALWMNDTWDFGSTQRAIICKEGNTYSSVADITSEPVPFK